MDKYTPFVFFLIALANIANTTPIFTDGYYWRDYKGAVPKDALSAGYNNKGTPIFIGQVLVEDKLIPGKLYNRDTNIYYEFGERAWSTNKNVKILCTQTPENFEWIPTSNHEITNLSNQLLIEGGFEPGFKTYIGRVYRGGETNVGKVVCGESNCLGLYTTRDGEALEYHAYEVLSYNSNNINSYNYNNFS